MAERPVNNKELLKAAERELDNIRAKIHGPVTAGQIGSLSRAIKFIRKIINEKE